MLHIKAERNLFSRFHRQLFCWIDEWHGLSMIDIRRIEDEVKKELDQVKLNKAFFFHFQAFNFLFLRKANTRRSGEGS
jgi:hypothetical protein